MTDVILNKMLSFCLQFVMTSSGQSNLGIFHNFIEISALKPPESAYFPEFQYMEQEIRKNFKQVKKINISEKPCEQFMEYWKELSKDEQVHTYIRWMEMLARALKQLQTQDLPDREAELYVRKHRLSKWQKYKIKLSKTSLFIIGRRLKEYPLQCYSVRKSKNKERFSWVMEVVLHRSKWNLKPLTAGSNNILEFEEWFKDIETRIYVAKIEYFKARIRNGKPKEQIERDQMPSPSIGKHKKSSDHIQEPSVSRKIKTLTQLVISNEMKIDHELDAIQEGPHLDVQRSNPNIFRRLFPQYKQHLNLFTDTPHDSTLLHCDKQYRLFSLPPTERDGITSIKIMIMMSYSRSAVFEALTESATLWNPEVEIFTVKTKVASENSALIYEKHRSQGFLYRDRDYLYLRHCFQLKTGSESKEKLFIIEKSIASVNHPPFMTLARGQKQLIYCIMGDPQDKECLLVVEGWIRGGGYMSPTHDKEMTLRTFKKLLSLEGYLKQRQYMKPTTQGQLFQEVWIVDVDLNESMQSYEEQSQQEPEEQEQFYSAEEIQDEGKPGQKRDRKEEYEQFMKKTSGEHLEQQKQEFASEVPKNEHAKEESMLFDYKPPQFDQNRNAILPTSYLHRAHSLKPFPKSAQSAYFPHHRGHHLWKGEWAICLSGGLNYVDQEKMNEQKKVLTYIIRTIGKNIFSGKGILNVSLPVDIFCRESNIQRLAMSFGYCPNFMEKATKESSPVERMKYIVASGLGSSLIYLTMEKPFNPILGETFQCWIDGCPLYFEQISHHPPIAAYLMIGRGYRISGTIEAKMDISINSGTGINEGVFKVEFDDGQIYCYTTAPGELSGLTYGERLFKFTQRTYYWNIKEGLFLELIYDPAAKAKRFFSSSNYTGEEKLHDYFEGQLRRYKKDQLEQFLCLRPPSTTAPKNCSPIPKSLPPYQNFQQLHKYNGRWSKAVFAGGEQIFDVDTDRYYRIVDEEHPLQSQSGFREDVVYRRLNNFVLAQEFKQLLQVRQRKDKKMRDEGKKKLKR